MVIIFIRSYAMLHDWICCKSMYINMIKGQTNQYIQLQNEWSNLIIQVYMFIINVYFKVNCVYIKLMIDSDKQCSHLNYVL